MGRKIVFSLPEFLKSASRVQIEKQRNAEERNIARTYFVLCLAF